MEGSAIPLASLGSESAGTLPPHAGEARLALSRWRCRACCETRTGELHHVVDSAARLTRSPRHSAFPDGGGGGSYNRLLFETNLRPLDVESNTPSHYICEHTTLHPPPPPFSIFEGGTTHFTAALVRRKPEESHLHPWRL